MLQCGSSWTTLGTCGLCCVNSSTVGWGSFLATTSIGNILATNIDDWSSVYATKESDGLLATTGEDECCCGAAEERHTVGTFPSIFCLQRNSL